MFETDVRESEFIFSEVEVNFFPLNSKNKI